jgi:hypothetical protein
MPFIEEILWSFELAHLSQYLDWIQLIFSLVKILLQQHFLCGKKLKCQDDFLSYLALMPFHSAYMFCSISALKASTADIVAQKAASVAASIKDIDVRRNAAFLVYGGAYQGIFQEFLFNRIFPLLFGDDVGLTTALKKVMVDMFIVSPFLCLPVAYVIKALAFKQSAIDGVKRYIGDVKNSGLLIKYWKVWAPVQTMTFTIVPAQFRITFIACFSFFWLIVLSAISSKND